MTCPFCLGTVNHKALGNTLRDWRERLGLKQAWVARAMGITNTYLCQLESGKRPSWSRQLVDAFSALCEEEERTQQKEMAI